MDQILDKFLNLFGGEDARNSIDKVLIQSGYGDEVGYSYWSKDTYDFLGCFFEPLKTYEFMEHKELVSEMENFISRFRNDDTMIKVYVSNILGKLEDITEYFYPKTDSRKIFFEIAQKLHYPSMFKRPYQKLYDELWERAEDEIDKKYDGAVMLHEEWENLKQERYDDLVNGCDIEGDKEDLQIINRISWEIRSST